MKKLLILSVIIYAALSDLNAQFQFVFRIGMSPATNPRTAPLLVGRQNPIEEFQFNMIHTKPQFYAGIGAHLPLAAPFFLEGGFSFTRRTSVYQMNYTIVTESNPAEKLMTESESLVLLPVNIGFSVGKFDFTSGLTAIKNISSSKEMMAIKGFHKDENSFRLGWQMGARYAIRRVLAGVEYQGTLNRVGEGMYVNGQSLEVMNIPGNFVFSIQYRF